MPLDILWFHDLCIRRYRVLFQQNCISPSIRRDIFKEKLMCLQSLTISSCCCLQACSMYTTPSNSEKWGTVWLHLQDSFCICNCPGCMYEVGPTALESSAHCLSGLLKGLGGLKTTLLPESFAPVIAVRNSSHHPGRAANTESAHVRLWWVNRWFSSLICPSFACLPPCTAQCHRTAGTRWFYSERS